MSSPTDRFNLSISVRVVTNTQQSVLLEGLQTWLNLGLIEDGQVNLHVNAINADPVKCPSPLELKATLQPATQDFLAGLDAWLQLGLLTQAQLLAEIQVSNNAPNLLKGLDAWLQLGLLSRTEVLQICHRNLTCWLPPIAPKATPEPVQHGITTPANQRFADEHPSVPASPHLPVARPSPPPRPRPPSPLSQILQSLSAELSVLWLLLLGVFMVVISSAVLAASQWERFPAFIQYGVLWFYTLAFWGSSVWAGQHANLRLTTQALQIITLLLVPLNFLAIDLFGLWHPPLGWFVVLMAVASLTGLTMKIFQARSTDPVNRSKVNIPLLNHLGLSYIHLNWSIGGLFPILATYVAVVGTTVLSRYPRSQPPIPPAGNASPSHSQPFSLNGAVLLYAVAIVLLRAIFISGISVVQLGLAIGLCGWLLIQQAPPLGEAVADQPLPPNDWERWGGSLLLLGWLLTFAQIPWQALVISGLGVLVLAQRLLRTWDKGDLGAMLLVGLQMVFLAWYGVPDGERRLLLQLATQWSGTEAMPVALLGLVLFPYLALLLALFDGLLQIRRRELAELTGWLALAFGSMLTILSLLSPSLRTLNVGLSTLALAMVTGRQQQRNLGTERQQQLPETTLRSLADLTHLGGLFTLAFAIDWFQPRLGLVPWAAIGLALTVGEWWFSLGQPLTPDPDDPPRTLPALVCQSCWKFGLILSGLTYTCLLVNLSVQANPTSFLGHPAGVPSWGSLWLIAPLTLTGLIARVRTRRSLANWLSLTAVVLAQGLTLPAPPVRVLSLGIATGLALVNTRHLQELLAAALTVGFGLGFIAALINQFLPALALANCLLLGAIAPFVLWLLRHGLARCSNPLAELYQQAMDGWAIALCSIEVFLLILPSFNPALELVAIPASSAIGTALLLMAVSAYRSWQTRQPLILWYNVAVTLLLQIPFLFLPKTRWLSLGAATLLLLIQTRLLHHLAAAAITIGLGLGMIGFCLWDGVGAWSLRSTAGWLLAGAIGVAGLWLFRSLLLRRSTQLAGVYSRALDGWAIGLSSLTLAGLTLHSLLVYSAVLPASILPVAAAAISVAAIGYRAWEHPTNWTLSALGWSLELLTLEVVGIAGRNTIALAIANTALGLLTQVIGDWWHRRTNRPHMLSCWHILPLVYGALGSALRWNLLTSWTGLSSLGLVLIAIGVGRRQPAFKPLLYLAVLGVSLSAYELLLYQVIHLPLGDQLLAMAALTTTIVYAYRILTPWLTDYLCLTPMELRVISHLHWAWGSLLLLAALPFPSKVNNLVGLGAGLFLTRYAIMQGRNHPNQVVGEAWVYLGLLDAAGMGAYIAVTVPFLSAILTLLKPWWGAMASYIAVAVYLLPWQRWGWSERPWHVVTTLAPIVGIFASQFPHPLSLVVVAGFYGWLGRGQQQVRWFYASLLLIDWAIWLGIPEEISTFAQSCVVGLSILSVTWFEPTCQLERGRSLRHNLSCLGLGLIGMAALLLYSQPGLVPALVGILVIFLGLGLRIRAFLYVGTITFLAITIYQMVILITLYPLLKWVIGLLVGIAFIWIAASFETRRSQFVTLLRNWLTEFETWK